MISLGSPQKPHHGTVRCTPVVRTCEEPNEIELTAIELEWTGSLGYRRGVDETDAHHGLPRQRAVKDFGWDFS